MTSNQKVAYPMVFEEYNDETGHYFVATAPDVKGVITDGETLTEALINAEDALGGMLLAYQDLPSITSYSFSY